MQLFINGRFLNQPVTGVQRYALELCKALDGLIGTVDPGSAELICLVPPDTANLPQWHNIELRQVGRRTGNLWEQTDLPWQARGSLLFSPANIGPYFHPHQVVTIHDASVYAFPQAYSLPFRTKYRLTWQRMAKIARRVITDSEFSKTELVKYCNMNPDRVEVVPLGSEHLAGIVPDETILDRTGLRSKRYFLGVGSQSPHKNFRGLIEAFRRLQRDDVELVIVGGTFSRVFQSGEQELPANARHLGYVKDTELRALYQHAVGFVFPSFYEGFGIPVLEAMSAGCPVVCSNAASLPEVGGDAVLYCDPENPDTIAWQMATLLDDPALHATLRAAGYQQIQQFSWQTVARRTWDILLEEA